MQNSDTLRRTLIYGAGSAGRAIARELQKQKDNLLCLGYIDDDTQKQNRSYEGLFVLGDRSQLVSLIETENINQLIVAIPSERQQIINETLHDVLSFTKKIDIQIVPSIFRYFDEPLLSNLEDGLISHLFDCDVNFADIDAVASFYKGKRVLVTGAGGSIGTEISKMLLRFELDELVLLGRGEGSIYNLAQKLAEFGNKVPITYRIADVKDKSLMRKTFNVFRPDVVFHAAAHKHVPLMEENIHEAILNNVFGTLSVLESAQSSGVSTFVFVSTDKAVYPSNIMGASKRLGELLTGGFGSTTFNTATVRFGNVIGSRGSVIPLFKEQIRRGGPVTVTHPEMERFFMSIPEAALLVLHAGALTTGSEAYILDMGKPYNITELAQKMIEYYSGANEKKIEIVYSGLRQGEKIHEVLTYDDELLSSTKNSRIMKVSSKKTALSVDALTMQLGDRNELYSMEEEQLREIIHRLI